ncbi:unnamed protein product [Cunninghamella blakesleeana]
MNNNASYPPPQLPQGWLALWDEKSQRYYYVEQATGKTQWEVPTGDSNIPSPMGFPTPNNTPQSTYSPSSTPAYPQQQPIPAGGESNSYIGTAGNNTNNINNSTPSGSSMPGDGTNDRGLGSFVSGFMKPSHGGGSHGFPGGALGGALGGAALTLAATKLAGKHSNHSGGHSSGASGLIGNLFGGGGSGHNNGYYPPPPPPNYGYGYDQGYGHGNHGHHGHHGHHGNHAPHAPHAPYGHH